MYQHNRIITSFRIMCFVCLFGFFCVFIVFFFGRCPVYEHLPKTCQLQKKAGQCCGQVVCNAGPLNVITARPGKSNS